MQRLIVDEGTPHTGCLIAVSTDPAVYDSWWDCWSDAYGPPRTLLGPDADVPWWGGPIPGGYNGALPSV